MNNTQRKLVWQSTLQLSLTLAMANPMIWYLLDRSPSGLICCIALSVVGAVCGLTVDPNLVPTPRVLTSQTQQTMGGDVDANRLKVAWFGHDSIATATWIASVLFVSCLLFGNVGRRI